MTERNKFIYTMRPGGCWGEDGCPLAGRRGLCPVARTTKAESVITPAKDNNALYMPAACDESVRKPFHDALTRIGLRLRSGHDNFFLAIQMAKRERNFSYECNVEGSNYGTVYVDRTTVKQK